MDNNIMNWDDVIENDGQEYILLPEGDYNYRVTNFERGQFPGGPKIPPCPKASLTLTVDTEQGTATARVDLLLYRTVEWKMAAFFRSIGQKKHGEHQQPVPEPKKPVERDCFLIGKKAVKPGTGPSGG